VRKILKIGDKIYAQSLQYFSPSYSIGFPQREQFLLQHCRNMEFSFFRHQSIDDIRDIVNERKRLKIFLNSHKFDYLMVDNPFSSLIIDESIVIPIVFDCIDWYDEMFLKEFGVNKKYYLLRYGYLDLLKRASKVIAQSPVILEAMKSWGLQTNNFRIISNGYDASFFYPYSVQKSLMLRNKFEKKYKISLKGKNVVMYCGKVGKWYDNIKIIAEAITNNDLFFIVGDGPILAEIPNKENIIKCGAVEFLEVPDYMNIADVFVFPVEIDCSPIVISEYLAIGKPIVMGKGRMEWLLKDGKSGRMVENNVFSWRHGIEDAIKMKNSCKKNNLRISKELSWQKLSKRLSDFLEK